MLGEQFYLWLRQAKNEDLQRARDAIQLEMEMREDQLRMEHERLWREFPLPAFTRASMKDVSDCVVTNPVIRTEKFSIKPQVGTIANYTIVGIKCQQWLARSKRGCEECLHCL